MAASLLYHAGFILKYEPFTETQEGKIRMKHNKLLIGLFTFLFVGIAGFDVYEMSLVHTDSQTESENLKIATNQGKTSATSEKMYPLAVDPQDNQDWTLLNGDTSNSSDFDIPYISSNGQVQIAKIKKGQVQFELANTKQAYVSFRPHEVLVYLPKSYFGS
jgi:hypothetical protein